VVIATLHKESKQPEAVSDPATARLNSEECRKEVLQQLLTKAPHHLCDTRSPNHLFAVVKIGQLQP